MDLSETHIVLFPDGHLDRIHLSLAPIRNPDTEKRNRLAIRPGGAIDGYKLDIDYLGLVDSVFGALLALLLVIPTDGQPGGPEEEEGDTSSHPLGQVPVLNGRRAQCTPINGSASVGLQTVSPIAAKSVCLWRIVL